MKSSNDKPGMYAQRMLVTPEMAARWLESANTHNRKVSQPTVDAYARDMVEGRWEETNQGIAFSTGGVLLDGQHRLWAIVQADLGVWMWVFFNVSKSAQLVVDQNRPRSVADAITLQGGMGRVTQTVVAVMRSMIRGAGNKGGTGRKPTIQEERKLLEKHWEAIHFSIEHTASVRGGVRGIRSASVRGVIARAWYSQDHNELIRFCDALKHGIVSREQDSSVSLLWSFLVQSANSGTGSVQLRERYLKTERALVAFLSGEPIKKLYAAPGEMFLLPEESVQQDDDKEDPGAGMLVLAS